MSVLGSLEYRFPLNRQLSGFLFVDAGTVARAPSKLDLEDFHLGTGIGLHLHTTDRLLVRMQVAAGEDGIAFNASFRASDRVRRSSKRR
ncbi:MAG: BamA/TamA family outer membrane protein [Kofleriaceae bacterium]|nr:BamA/TamA family outer membrane protein [Kofleriaceae bacterium]